MSTLKKLSIASNTSEGVQALNDVVVFQVTTTESSTVTVERSADGVTYSEIPDLSWTINGTDEFNLTDCKAGQYFRVKSTGAMTVCKALL